jgi:hypothetical protein
VPPRQLRNLTPPIAADPESPQRWKVVGLELAHQCTFCGAPSEATVGCPDETAPLMFQIGVCNSCLVDSVLQRFKEVKRQRLERLGHDTIKAVNAIAEARKRAGWERYERNSPGRTPDPEVEAEAIRRLADEEESIARKYYMPPNWSCDEFERGYHQDWRERRRK